MPFVCFFLTAGALLLEDQHRMQPWMIHSLWLSVLIFLGSPRQSFQLIIALTASLYFYSALSKMNWLFLEQHGEIILSGLFRVLKLNLERIPQTVQKLLIAGFPLGEGLVGIGLLFAGTRRLAAVFAMGMHLLLILTFSSRGLNHEWGVLLWNLFFLLQAGILWGMPTRGTQNERSPAEKENSESIIPRVWLCRGLLMVIWCYPVLRFTGHLDQWLGWSLYSPRSEVVRILLGTPPEELDEQFPRYTSQSFHWMGAESSPVAFLPDRWSIAELHVPLNPDSRIEFAVALALCEKFDCWDSMVVVVEQRNLMSPDDRQTQQSSGREDIRELSHRYRLPVEANHRYLQNDSR